MQIDWGKHLDMTGIGYGYTNHQKQLRAGLERRGIEITDEAEIAVHITPAGNFEPTAGKVNVLYTMYESLHIPNNWIEPLQGADLIVVPCSHNKKLFQAYTNVPIEVCLEGVEIDKFIPANRQFPTNRPFRFGWFGASNQRKGYKHMIAAWSLLEKHYPDVYKNCELVMKTTQNTEDAKRISGYDKGKPIYEIQPNERVVQIGNCTVDTRRLPVVKTSLLPGLVDFYHDSHAFVFPTMGEGFGLTLAEAMSTALPCIYTPFSGPKDFINEKTGYPLKFRFTPVKAVTPCTDENGKTYMREDLKTHAASADVNHMVRRMVQIYSDYETALKKGKLASEHIQKYITWDKSAESFENIIRNFMRKTYGKEI